MSLMSCSVMWCWYGNILRRRLVGYSCDVGGTTTLLLFIGVVQMQGLDGLVLASMGSLSEQVSRMADFSLSQLV